MRYVYLAWKGLNAGNAAETSRWHRRRSGAGVAVWKDREGACRMAGAATAIQKKTLRYTCERIKSRA
jgi:hypothetical protein